VLLTKIKNVQNAFFFKDNKKKLSRC